MRFLDKVKNTIESYGMDLRDREPVLVAFSGGADSTSLLIAMHELGYDVHALHVNHNLRGAESMRDEGFCCGVCASLKIDIEVASVDVTTYGIKHKMSTETAARDLRYKAFSENRFGIKKIVVAHNLNDSLETTIYNLTRGTSLNGLCGVAPTMYRSDLDIKIFRPLIECTREEIEDYLKEKHIDFVTDSTNKSNDYTRNIIRNRVIPILSEINPSIIKTYGNTVKVLRDDNKYINDRASCLTRMLYDHKELDLDWLSNTDNALLSRVLTTWLKKHYNINVNRSILSNVIKAVETKSSVQISKTLMCKVHENKLFIENRTGEIENRSIDLNKETIRIIGLNDFVLSNADIDFEYSTIKIKKISTIDSTVNVKNVLAVEKDANITITLRHRHPGDKIKLFKRPTKSLKDLFNSGKIPNYQRDRLVVAETDNDGVIFVDKFGTCDKYRYRQPVDGEKLDYFEIIIENKFDTE